MMFKKNVNANSLKWYPKSIGFPSKNLLEKLKWKPTLLEEKGHKPTFNGLVREVDLNY